MTKKDKDIAEVIDAFFQFVPSRSTFPFDSEYNLFKEKIDAATQLNFYTSVISYQNEIKKLFSDYKYYDFNGATLTDEGRQAKRLGHEKFQKRLDDIEDEKWYKSILARKNYRTYRATQIIAWISFAMSVGLLILKLIEMSGKSPSHK